MRFAHSTVLTECVSGADDLLVSRRLHAAWTSFLQLGLPAFCASPNCSSQVIQQCQSLWFFHGTSVLMRHVLLNNNGWKFVYTRTKLRATW
ncbi:jg26978 [Pararge aegeria aegeria]|uniref:Jg26978 protein n=1 Tax=Pararge aegeria aegeria TaxID=348720 RepID=A0A8S4RVF9_9NEOP|nr:jg26978 [Pararge aegeria aegeria]